MNTKSGAPKWVRVVGKTFLILAAILVVVGIAVWVLGGNEEGEERKEEEATSHPYPSSEPMVYIDIGESREFSLSLVSTPWIKTNERGWRVMEFFEKDSIISRKDMWGQLEYGDGFKRRAVFDPSSEVFLTHPPTPSRHIFRVLEGKGWLRVSCAPPS